MAVDKEKDLDWCCEELILQMVSNHLTTSGHLSGAPPTLHFDEQDGDGSREAIIAKATTGEKHRAGCKPYEVEVEVSYSGSFDPSDILTKINESVNDESIASGASYPALDYFDFVWVDPEGSESDRENNEQSKTRKRSAVFSLLVKLKT